MSLSMAKRTAAYVALLAIVSLTLAVARSSESSARARPPTIGPAACKALDSGTPGFRACARWQTAHPPVLWNYFGEP